MEWTVLFPVKSLPAAKSRLAPGSASPAEHADLVRAMWADTLAAVLATPGVARVVVVADTPAALAELPTLVALPKLAVERVDRLVQRRPGLNAALREADDYARSHWPAAARAAVVGDLPGLTSGALGAVLDSAVEHARAFVADHSGHGTTVLTATGGPLEPGFGTGSAARHALTAVRLAAPSGARYDVDVPGDLHAGGQLGPATAAVLAAREAAATVRYPVFTSTRQNRPVSDTDLSLPSVQTPIQTPDQTPVELPVDSALVDADIDPEPGDTSELAADLPADRFSNRELSWLAFNSRVLAQAESDQVPLLERAKFLAIFASNLDEFYMVRIAGLKRRTEMGLRVSTAAGLSARETLARLAEATHDLAVRHARLFVDDLEPRLATEGIAVVHWGSVGNEARVRLAEYFRSKIFPVLTPLAVDPAHPFPYISGRSMNLAVIVREPGSDIDRFARVKVPNNVPRFVVVSETSSTAEFLPLEELIAAHLPMLFPGMTVVEHHLFRVTRNADVEVEEDRDEDLLQALERELAKRRFGPAVRLEVGQDIDDAVLALLVSEIEVEPEDVQKLPGLLDLTSLWQIYALDRPALKDKPFTPSTPPRFAEGETPKSVFATLREGDVLVHHPYESFATSVQRFVEQAAADKNVLAIKHTLYRTSGDSPIVDALISAAEAGKQVVVLVEIKARFDEQANISWARALERAGCHVVYGLVGLKTHCKTVLVVRQEGTNLRRYAHVGTGNYNPKTARMYEDLGLFTADEAICSDLTDLFNVLTGYSRQTDYRKLLVAPFGVRAGLIARIEREIEHARAGRGGHVQIKTNHLVDEQMSDALYRASAAGVRVQLLVRTFCTIRAGVPGLSENIELRSILGRFLEHSRISYFANDGDPEYFIGSSDLMHRNLDRRVEVLVPVADKAAVAHLRACLDAAFSSDTNAWTLQGDGSWKVVGHVDYQEMLLHNFRDRDE